MYAFSAIDNQHLQYLWEWNQHNLTILNGRLFFRLNPKLCMSEIHKMWDKTGITVKPEEGDFRNNGERASCEYLRGRSLCTFLSHVRLIESPFLLKQVKVIS